MIQIEETNRNTELHWYRSGYPIVYLIPVFSMLTPEYTVLDQDGKNWIALDKELSPDDLAYYELMEVNHDER